LNVPPSAYYQAPFQGGIAKSSEMFQEKREVNRAYLALAQQMVHANPDEAIRQLGISSENAEYLGSLTSEQLNRLAGSSMLICGLRAVGSALSAGVQG
jgi:hypothetical protein